MQHLLLLLICFTTLSCNDLSAGFTHGQSIHDAMNAYFRMEDQKAYQLFTQIWKDESQSLDDRTKAGRFKAKMDWLFYQQNDKAYETIAKLVQLDKNLSETYLLKARMLASESRYEEAIEAAKHAIATSTSATETYFAKIGQLTYVFEKHQALLKEFPAQFAIDDAELLDGYANVQQLAKENAGDVDLAKLQLGYALLVQQGPAAFDAWMSYYRLTNVSQVHPSLLKDAASFQHSLSSFSPNRQTASAYRNAIKGLAESGFFEYAIMLKQIYKGTDLDTDVRIKEIEYYHSFLQQVDSITIDFYRKTLKDNIDQNAYQEALIKEAKKLWDKLSWTKGKPTFSREKLVSELTQRFKAISKIFTSNGYFGLNMGHIILDDTRRIEQYDESADFALS